MEARSGSPDEAHLVGDEAASTHEIIGKAARLGGSLTESGAVAPNAEIAHNAHRVSNEKIFAEDKSALAAVEAEYLTIACALTGILSEEAAVSVGGAIIKDVAHPAGGFTTGNTGIGV